MNPIRILIVDDHKLIRDGVMHYLEDDDRFQVKGEAENGPQALEWLTKNEVDLVIMDISMGEMDGITCTGLIKSKYPGIKVIALTMMNETLHIKQMLKAGASGYLLKNSGGDEVKKAILTVMDGQSYYSEEVTRTVMQNLSKHQTSQNSRYSMDIPLTNREQEVLRLIIKEYSNKEIAEALFISPRTVDAHKRNLLEKTGAKNIAGLVLYAINKGLYEDL